MLSPSFNLRKRGEDEALTARSTCLGGAISSRVSRGCEAPGSRDRVHPISDPHGTLASLPPRAATASATDGSIARRPSWARRHLEPLGSGQVMCGATVSTVAFFLTPLSRVLHLLVERREGGAHCCSGPQRLNQFMHHLPTLLSIFVILYGVFLFVFGGYDDSPGAQGLGLVIVVASVAYIVKQKRNSRS